MKKVKRKRKLITLFGICLFVIATIGISTPAMAVNSSWLGKHRCTASITAVPGTAPNIDGTISEAEWVVLRDYNC